jgi:hypothetical protein
VIALLGLLVLALSPQDGSTVERALESSDFSLAWQLMESEQDSLEQARWRTEILYRAGDPSGALEAAREGLAADPADLRLLLRATGAALWLQDELASSSYAPRLRSAVQESKALTPEERPAWLELSADLIARSEELERHAGARDRAVSRSRWISFAGLGLLIAMIGWNVRPGYGRSSSPVS